MPTATEPAAPPAGPAFTGHLHLEAGPGPGRTVLTHQSFRAPLHIGKAYWDGHVLQVRVVNPTAGILRGDRIDLRARVAGGASLMLVTPAATRAFTMPEGTATFTQDYRVEAGGWLEVAPEPLYPHAGSDYTQSTRLETAAGAGLFFADILAPGRAGRGEVWAWRRLQLDLDVVHDGAPVLRERLDHSGDELRAIAAFHGFAEAWIATIVVVGAAPDDGHPAWASVRALHAPPGLWVGATRLAPAVRVIRIVAAGSLVLRDTLTGLRRLFAPALPGLASPLRKV